MLRVNPHTLLVRPQIVRARATIDFDEALDRHIRRRAEKTGSDGKALSTADGAPYQVNLAEKLIVVILPDTGERYLSTVLFQEPTS